MHTENSNYEDFLNNVVKCYLLKTPHRNHRPGNRIRNLPDECLALRTLSIPKYYRPRPIHFEWVVFFRNNKHYQDKIEVGLHMENIDREIPNYNSNVLFQLKQYEQAAKDTLGSTIDFSIYFPSARPGCTRIFVLHDYISDTDTESINWAVDKMIDFQSFFLPKLATLSTSVYLSNSFSPPL